MVIGNMGIKWDGLFDPTHGVIDSLIRGTIVYLGLYALLRMTNTGGQGPSACRTCC